MDLGSYDKTKHVTFGQIIKQFMRKTLQIILGSRIPYSCNGEVKKSNKWYNLVLGRDFAAMDDLSVLNTTLTEPMVIDIALVKKSDKFSLENVIERWIVRYESQTLTVASEVLRVSFKKTYKKLIILLRSVYSVSRLLPAYEVFRKLSSLSKNCGFNVKYNVGSSSRRFFEAELLMKRYSFVPVETEQGRFCVSVFYLEDLPDFNMDAFIFYPLGIISDYGDSPFPSTNESSSTIQKVSRDAKEDCGWLSNSLSSSRFPIFGSSRISRKLSFVDDSNDCDFSSLFIVDNEASLNLDGTISSQVSSQTSSRATKSQDAAVGALVHLLRSAPPLRRHCGNCHKETAEEDGAASQSQLSKLRKTSDALEELKLYSEMKNMMLSKSNANSYCNRKTKN